MESGICKMCQTPQELCGSHIIPKLAYEPVQDKIQRILPIGCSSIFKIVQSGIKEPMLCKGCENILSNYEGELKKYLVDVQKEDGKNPKIKRETDKNASILLTNNYDYNKIRKAVISIIWRLSQTKSRELKTYNLGDKNEESFRTICLNNEELPLTKYPISVDKLQNDGLFVDGMIMTFEEGKNKNSNVRIQSVCMYGMIFSVYMKDDISKFFDRKYEMLYIGGAYNPILIVELKDFFTKNRKILSRLSDADVVSKMGKMKT